MYCNQNAALLPPSGHIMPTAPDKGIPCQCMTDNFIKMWILNSIFIFNRNDYKKGNLLTIPSIYSNNDNSTHFNKMFCNLVNNLYKCEKTNIFVNNEQNAPTKIKYKQTVEPWLSKRRRQEFHKAVKRVILDLFSLLPKYFLPPSFPRPPSPLTRSLWRTQFAWR